MIQFTLNGTSVDESLNPKQTLLDYLRSKSLYSVKNGCREGDCGMCTVLVNGNPVRSCMLKLSEITGKNIITLEGISDGNTPHIIQKAFMESGAIQCGFCTPAQILTVKALLDRDKNPTDTEIRNAISGVQCRCTGYVRIIDAVHMASKYMQEQPTGVPVVEHFVLNDNLKDINIPEAYFRKDNAQETLLPIVYTPASMKDTDFVGQAEIKVDAKKLAMGKPVFTDDFKLEGMLYGALLTSPHAHAIIKDIDTSRAKALPGVEAVLTYQDIERVKYASGGQSYPQPLPYDQASLDNKVRHVGDRVALVAAETPELAEEAMRLIKVEYEVLPAALTAEEAMKDGAPVIHDEEDTEGVFDPKHNIVYHIEASHGDVDQALKDADHVFEGTYRTPKQQHAQMEPHVCISYWDEDERLVLRSSTQVPYHARRIVAPLLGLPVKRIRVIKPRLGGGFGGKQEIIMEDMCGHLTIATGRPVRMEYSRKQEFISSRSRHPQIITYKVAIKDEIVTGIDMNLIGDTGAYGSHGLTVQMVGGFKGLTLYNPYNARFTCDVVYTNTPPAGAYRGYGSMQCEYAIEVLMAEIADKLNLDVVEFKRKNWIKIGEPMHMAKQLGEGREGIDQMMETSGMDACVAIGLKATDYYNKRKLYENQSGIIRKGIGMAVVFHGSGVAGLDMAAATIKMNDDGSFNLQMGATDLGTGSDTILAQIAAEVLQVPVNDFIVYTADTDFTPFDTGAYASSTTYISGGAVKKAAEQIKQQILEHAATMLDLPDTTGLEVGDKKVKTADGRMITYEDIALSSLHNLNQHQIMTTASHFSLSSPPPTAAQFAEITVDTETGEVKIDRLLMIVDCGRVINPITASGQVEGGLQQGIGFTLSEDSIFDANGKMLNARLKDYHTYSSNDMPPMDVIFVQTDESTGPFGAKSISEISIDGVAPSIVNAIYHATGVWMRDLPLTPERVWKNLHK
ncbi:MAG: molybdopterin-dependent oxidoreductase [Anaerolineaceae bacterium]|nr:molybdopterin-dependent oxidoreductase [Anaerolineaceae bacterium]